MKQAKKIWNGVNVKIRDFLASLCFSGPSFLGMLMFFVAPFCVVIYYSFIAGALDHSFVGLKNYINVWNNGAFRIAVKNTAVFSGLSVPLAVVKKEEQTGDAARRIFLFERGSQFELLSGNPETYMWVSPMPKEILERWGLVQRDCPENRKQYKDILIYRRDYKLTPLDQAFITKLCRSKRGCMQT